MGKIFRYEEINRKKNQHVEYSESYEVKFWIQDGEFLKQKTEMYFGKTKVNTNMWLIDGKTITMDRK